MRLSIIRKPRVTLIALAFFLLPGNLPAQQAPRSPSDTVRDFYKAMREKRFVEAWGMTIYRSAIEGLKPAELEDLRPDFEKAGNAVPDKVDISGEQISGDDATVFLKVPKDNDPSTGETEPIALIREDGQWIIGDRENQKIVKKAGNKFFFNARIETHQNEVQDVFKRINLAQLAYQQSHNGLFADMPTLITAGLLPKDLEGTESTGYRFHIDLAKDAKSFSVGAEPAQYGRTGLLSYFMDRNGIRSADVSGKRFSPPPEPN
jgi:hypothetical protein